jgi:integral membrane protein (TIGR01906 family)
MSGRGGRGAAAAAVVLSLLLLFIIIITSIEAVCCWTPGWFRNEYEKYEVLGDTDMYLSMDEALRVTDVMMDYLTGERDDLSVKVDDAGTEREFFTEREKAHLKDVRAVFLNAMMLRRIAAVLAVPAFIFLCFRRSDRQRAAKAFLRTSAAAVIVLAVLALAVSIDFDFWFRLMHRILFDNDLWLLNSDDSDLIDLLPLHFFMDTAVRSALIAAAAYAAVNLPAAVMIKKIRSKRLS